MVPVDVRGYGKVLGRDVTVKAHRIDCRHDEFVGPPHATWARSLDAIRARFTVKNWVVEVRSRIQLLVDTGVIRRKAGSGITGPEAYEAAPKHGGPIL